MTIYDVAKAAGVSASTVSRVLNNKPGISEETRARVKEILEQSRFQPSEAAQLLATNTARVVVCFMTTITQEYHATQMTIINRLLSEQGFSCQVIWTGYDPQQQARAISDVQIRKNVAGMILIGDSFQNPLVARAIRENAPEVPVIMLNGELPEPNVTGIIVDEDRGIERLVELLAGKGHRKLAFVMDRETVGRQRMKKAFLRACRREKVESSLIWHIEEHLYDKIQENLCRMMETHPELDGVIFADDLMASAGGKAFHSMGLQVPDRIAYTGNHNVTYSVISTPTITTLEGQAEEQCRIAIRMLLAQIDGEPAPDKAIHVAVSVVEREST